MGDLLRVKRAPPGQSSIARGIAPGLENFPFDGAGDKNCAKQPGKEIGLTGPCTGQHGKGEDVRWGRRSPWREALPRVP